MVLFFYIRAIANFYIWSTIELHEKLHQTIGSCDCHRIHRMCIDLRRKKLLLQQNNEEKNSR